MSVTPQPSSQTLTPALLLLMAVTTGIAVAGNYYAQPLLRTLSNTFSISETLAGTLVTTAQLSYALGLLFLSPLGDILERKRFIIVMMLLATLGLVISAISQNIIMLLIGTALAGLFSVVAQVLVPFASTLAKPAERGRVVGTMMSGLLIGILLARTFAGTVSTFGGWRMVYAIAAVMMLTSTLLLACYLPRSQPQTQIRYPQLISSILSLFKKHALLRLRSTVGALIFANFAILWTPLAYLLYDQYGYSDFTIGLFGLAGVAGALIAPLAGKYSDQGKAKQITTIGLLILAASWGATYFAPFSTLALIIGILLLDMAVQLVHIINMSEVYKLDNTARSRINAGYIFSYFIGGTLGSITSAYAYDHYQWLGVACCGVLVSIITLIFWFWGKEITVTDSA